MPRGERHTKATTEVSAVDNEADVDFASYAEKPLTPTQEDLAEYLEANVGISIDARSAALGARLYGYFQASQFNKARTIQRREQRVTDAETARAERAAAREAKAAEAKAAKASATAEEPAAPKQPARRGRKPAAEKETAATSATTGRGRGRGRKPAQAAAPF